MLKQNSGDKTCLAIVSAMATGTLPNEFYDSFPEIRPPYNMAHVAEYFKKHDLITGIGFPVLEVQGSDVSSVFSLSKIPAIIIVKRTEQEDHAIYWDGEKVFDPDPLTKNGRPLNSYDVKFVFTIIKTK